MPPFEWDESYNPPGQPQAIQPPAGGWIKLYRKTLHDGWLREHKLFVFWAYCLLRANHKCGKVFVDGQQIELAPGQFVTGRDQVFRDTGLTEQNYRTALKRLKSTGSITTKATNRCTVITIVNWSGYQARIDEPNEQPNEQPNGQPTSSQRAANDKQDVKRPKSRKEVERVPRALQGNSFLFFCWWGYAYKLLHDRTYRCLPTDAHSVIELTKLEPRLVYLVLRASSFLLSDHKFYKSGKTITRFLSVWTDGKITEPHPELLRSKGLIPDDGIKMEPWLQSLGVIP